MWFFDGDIVATCDACGAQHDIAVSELEVDCYGGEYHENGMGEEINYELSQIYLCENCGSEFEIKFDATEYPVDVLSYVIDNTVGADCQGMPYITYVDDSPIYTFPKPKLTLPETKLIADLQEINGTIPKLISLIQKDNNYIYHITPREFEEIVAELFRKNGFDVTLTKRTRDGGKDIIAVASSSMGIDTRYFIECKRHSIDNKVDVGIVRERYGVHSSRNGPNQSIIATTSTFTPDAIQFAQNEIRSQWDLSLKDINDVMSWINQYQP